MTSKEINDQAKKLYRFSNGNDDEFAAGGYEGFQDGARWAHTKTLDEVAEYLRANSTKISGDYIDAMVSELRIKYNI